MRFINSWKLLSVSLFSPLLFPAPSLSQHYQQTNLVSDIMGMAPVTDPNLKNPWGLTRSPGGSPFWVGNNNSGTSTLYDGHGNPFPPKQNGGPLVVTVPPPGFAPGTQSAPTGVVFNGSHDFQVAPAKRAIFLFATEDGTVSGWNPEASPPTSITNAILKVDNSDNGSANSAVYKGMTSAEIAGTGSSMSPTAVPPGSKSMTRISIASNLARTLFTRRRFPKALPPLTFKT